MMNRDEAAAALAGVDRTERKLAEHARWPFHRHAMFGLAEGLLVAGAAQPIAVAAGMAAAAMALVVVCITDDRRRHGMFVSGWRAGATQPLTLAMAAVLIVMLMVSTSLGDGESAQPLGYLLGAVAFAICTAISLKWERVYRAELASGGQR